MIRLPVRPRTGRRILAGRPRLPTYNSPNSMSLGPGVRLGSYEIVALIGAGGMGEVFARTTTA